MSIRTKRTIIKVCMAASAAMIVAQLALEVTGYHGGGRTAWPYLSCSLAILCGTLFLRSTRRRP